MTNETEKTETRDTVSGSRQQPVVMWGGFEVENFEGPRDFSQWNFSEPTPWLAFEFGKFYLVAPDWNVVNGEWESCQAGIPFLEMIKRYKEVFMNGEEGPEDLEQHKQGAIDALKQAIAILSDT